MARHRWMRSLALAFSLAAALQPAALAQPQQKDKRAADQDPLERERNVKKELREVYKKWLEQDVSYIITDEEKRAFKKLATDEEREQFIEAFWRRRDPNPDTDENEYVEEHYERIAYANQHFASGIPGWKTDRGRIYITFGPPHSKESHPMGGSYDRPVHHGGGSTSVYPFETWFYRHLPGVGSGIEIEFVDPTGSGQHRIARPPEEKDAYPQPRRGPDAHGIRLSKGAAHLRHRGFGSTYLEQDTPSRASTLRLPPNPPNCRVTKRPDYGGSRTSRTTRSTSTPLLTSPDSDQSVMNPITVQR